MIPLTRPTMPSMKAISKKIKTVLESGMLTNGEQVKEFEKSCSKYLGVSHTVAVSSGTAALMLSAKCLGLEGEVIVPSFTFTSSAHAMVWNNLKPVFADIDPHTFNIDPKSIEKKITKKTSAIVATHVFGNPCDISAIQKIAKKYNIKVVYDAAHAFGATYHNTSVAAYGDTSIFSFTPTKVLSTAEGGLVVAKNKKIAHLVSLGRNNGDSFNREEEFLGITARMSELSAILGVAALRDFKKSFERRKKMVALYHKLLATVPGISFQKILPRAQSAHKEMAIIINEKEYGKSRDALLQELGKKGIQAKVYFDPPLHKKKVYRAYTHMPLPHTEFVSKHIMSLPLYSHMPKKEVTEVCTVIKNFAS